MKRYIPLTTMDEETGHVFLLLIHFYLTRSTEPPAPHLHTEPKRSRKSREIPVQTDDSIDLSCRAFDHVLAEEFVKDARCQVEDLSYAL